MRILAIDPGNTHSAWVVMDDDYSIIQHNVVERVVVRERIKDGKTITDKKALMDENKALLGKIRKQEFGAIDGIVIEKIQSFGMAVGAEVFETVFWSGRFYQAFSGYKARITRMRVKEIICHSHNAKDANIRQALIDRFGAPGTAKSPGPTFGLVADLWAAFAVGVTFFDMRAEKAANAQ